MHSIPMVRIVSGARYSSERVGVSPDLAKRLSLTENGDLQVHVGKLSRIFKVSIRSGNKPTDTLVVHPSVIKKLYLQAERGYGYRIEAGRIYLGPVVGIMIEILGDMPKPFAGQTFFIKQLLTTGNEIGELCFAFSPNAINWKRNVITGYSYGKNGWRKQSFPIPDIVYPRERGYLRGNGEIRRRLAAQGVKFLNPPLIGKWKTYQVINENPELAGYLPDTRLLRNFRQIDSMIKKYQAVYLKPVIGSQGQNIIRVTRNKQSSGYQFQYQKNKQLFKGAASNLVQLQSSLRRVMGNRPYIAQKQIQLLQSEGHITDVRVLVQKDHQGRWGVTGMACRMGRSGSITSNISSGGSGRKLSSMLKDHFANPEKREQIERDIRYVALESASALEKMIGPAGEMGIDVGVDRWGKTWFIEANLRPARHVFNLIGEPKTRMRSVRNPMLYCRYLAGFQEGSN